MKDPALEGLDKRDAIVSEEPGLPRGILEPAAAHSRLTVHRYEPAPALKPFIDHHWIIEWNLMGRDPEEQSVLPSPHAHLVLGHGPAALFGVQQGISRRRLCGRGRALGLRFRSGGLRPFLNGAVHRLTDQVVAASRIIPQQDLDLAEAELPPDGHGEMIEVAERLLAASLPAPDPKVEMLANLVAEVRRDKAIRTVEQISRISRIGGRTLQRLFREYVGVPPKWVIRRYRLQEAAWRIGRGEVQRLADLAAELGYFDQAHLARDFTRLFGFPPDRYRQMAVQFGVHLDPPGSHAVER